MGQPTYLTGQPPQPGTAAGPPTETGIYLGPGPATKSGQRYEGETPDVHVVQKGDTLWDICMYYFGNPWRWPEIWGLNPQITNPHWIYPGNVVRLGSGAPSASDQGAATPTTKPAPTATAAPPVAAVGAAGLELRQLAFVSLADLKMAATVKGATQEQTLLSTNDDLFIDYPEGKPPQVGARYSIYTPQQDIVEPDGGQVIGKYVRIRGSVRITEVKKGKPARGTITDMTDADGIERGDRVGLLKTQFRLIPEVAPTASVEAVIVGIIGSDVLAGDGQVVFLDRGQADGVKVGNRLYVVRRGDAYPKFGSLTQPVDDAAYPENALGQVIVVDTGERTSLGWIARSDLDLHVGDHAVMRHAK
jgi:hypothetical protein